MSETLYRKYRPKTFSELVSQEHVRQTLLNQLRDDRVGHAYLFTGPRGVGKTTSARLLAKAVNCRNRKKDGEPCNTCEACAQIMNGQSVDIVEIDAASHTGVDNVRENIIENVRFAPAQWPYKVFIIDEVHMLSTSAFNALLKTLEEPPGHALFILATTEIHKVPQTIISRCQRFDFRPIPNASLKERLAWMAKEEGVEISDEVLSEVARYANGGQRDAESLLAQIFSIGGKKIGLDEASLVLPMTQMNGVLDIVEHLSRSDAPAAVRQLNTLLEEGVDMAPFAKELTELVRMLLMESLGPGTEQLAALSEEQQSRGKALVASMSQARLAELLERLIEARNTRSTIPQLPYEVAFVQFCGPSAQQSAPASAPAPEPKPEPPKTPAPAPTEEPLASPSTVPKKDDTPASQKEASKNAVNVEPVDQTVKELLEDAEIALPETQSDGTIKFTTVKGKWQEVADRVSRAHTSLSYLLQSAKLLGIEADQVRLGFDFKFHADTLNADKNRRMVEEVMKQVFGSQLRLRGEYVHADGDVVVGDVVAGLGGKEVG